MRDLLVVCVILGLFLGLGMAAVHTAREESRRLQCSNNLLQIGLALANYHDANRRFPSAHLVDAQGQPRSSWRVAVLPYISSSPFYDQYSFDEPWNSPGNLRLAQRNEGYFYDCPADRTQPSTTNYFAVTGIATAWPAPSATSLEDLSNPSGSILVVESANTGTHWLKPRDLPFDQLQLTIHAPSWMSSLNTSSDGRQAISSAHRNGANVLFADGSVEFLGAGTAPEALAEMLVIDGGRPRMPLGPRNRLRLVFDTASAGEPRPQKQFPYKLESYTTGEVP